MFGLRYGLRYALGYGLLAAVVLAAGACAGESKPALSETHIKLAKLCVDAGGEPAHCECQAAKLDELVTQEAIHPDVQRAKLLEAEGKEDEADAVMLGVPYDQRFEGMKLVANAMVSCDTPT